MIIQSLNRNTPLEREKAAAAVKILDCVGNIDTWFELIKPRIAKSDKSKRTRKLDVINTVLEQMHQKLFLVSSHGFYILWPCLLNPKYVKSGSTEPRA